MNSPQEPVPLSRREFVRATSALAVSALATGLTENASAAAPASKACVFPHPLLTHHEDFYDVSRGNPKPFTLTGEALTQARLTPASWRLEIVVDPFTSEQVKEPASLGKEFTLEKGTALDAATLTQQVTPRGQDRQKRRRSASV